ncbi:RNA-directed DNA polymerase from mobile element jockey-like [Elysia marginata]|uniref:RNA-directed DNA polymerase from mobile element jockey-like n=1 Tax=Elysia marginata TaxID=1093978 RepID=A0AAV4JSK7_9GAST|nr:RNA-directed DNA polymerase from mobile element jockey-like [Elysia marginata]
MTIVNTLFKQPARRLYTWKSPGDVRRNQIDYILMSSRFKNSAVNCRTYPGADIGSDHNPVIMQMKVKLKIPHSKQTKTVKYCTKLLRLSEEAEKYAVLVKNKFQCLYVEETDATRDIDQQWDCLKEAIEKTNEEFLPRVNREAKQEWITEDILDMMKERKRLKGSDAYKHIDNNIKMACKTRTAKEEWLNSKCDEIELLSQRNDLTAMLHKIKSFQPKQTVTASCIKGKDGEILFETEKIVLRWTEYVEELFSDQRCANLIQEHLQGPEILRNEVEKCLKDMKYGKAAGIDNISCEMLKALGDFGIDTLTELCNKMYHTAYIPEDLKTSVFILLPKKPRATDCSEYRTISLMCHVLKLLLTVIHKRIAQKIDSEISEMQAGFRKASGTREAIFSLKILVEKHIEMQKDMYA